MVELPDGIFQVEWNKNDEDDVIIKGTVAEVFTDTWEYIRYEI